MALCRDNVAGTRVTRDASIDRDVLTIQLRTPATQLFARITDHRVNQTIAIRLDGQVVSTPTINEPNGDGMLQIAGPNRAILARMNAAVKHTC